MDSCMLRVIYHSEIGGSVGSRLAGYFGEEKNVLPQLGIEPRLLHCALLHHVTTTKAQTARCNAVCCYTA